MSVALLARTAGLNRGEAVARAASDWLAGPGAPFLSLKRSEVSTLRRVSDGSTTQEKLIKKIEDHLNALARRRKGASRWERAGADKLTLLDSLLAAMRRGATSACTPPSDGNWARVTSQIGRSLTPEEQTALDLDRSLKASLEFLDYLVRLHQSREHWKEGKNPCQASQAS